MKKLLFGLLFVFAISVVGVASQPATLILDNEISLSQDLDVELQKVEKKKCSKDCTKACCTKDAKKKSCCSKEASKKKCSKSKKADCKKSSCSKDASAKKCGTDCKKECDKK